MKKPDLADPKSAARTLAKDAMVLRAFKRAFANEWRARLVAGGAPDDDEENVLLNTLANDARLYRRLWGVGPDDQAYADTYHIDIKGLGGVYVVWAPEYGTTGYFLSLRSEEHTSELQSH